MRAALWGAAMAAAALLMLLILLALALPAIAHDAHAWMRKFETPGGVNCCDATDVVPIGHAEANAAHVGTIITADFPGDPATPVTVQAIHQTEDPDGRPMLSKWGCLFRVFGS